MIRPLTTRGEKAEARALAALAFGSCPRIRQGNVLYGIRHGGKLVAFTMVQTELDRWTRPDYAVGLDIEVAISITVVDPYFRGQGLATKLRRHIQGIYKSLVTGTGAKSNKAAMHRLNQQTGFRVLWRRGRCTIWYWEKPS